MKGCMNKDSNQKLYDSPVPVSKRPEGERKKNDKENRITNLHVPTRR